MLEKKDQESFDISENLILVNAKATFKEEILNNLSKLLYKYGYVKESFNQALLEREGSYPTGLQASVAGVAIPHTDAKHVIKPALAIATLNTPVLFKAMDDPAKEIPVELVIVMAIKEPELQLQALQRIMKIIQNANSLRKIQQAQLPREVMLEVQKHLKNNG